MPLTARPWNMYSPDFSPWWLVPSAEWPAYKYSKFFFDWSKSKPGNILIGFYIEKGLGPEVKSVYPTAKGARMIMQKDWAWFHLMSDFKKGHFFEQISTITDQLPVYPHLKIDGGNPKDPSDFENRDSTWDEFLFEWDRSDQLRPISLSKKSGLLDQLAEVRTVEQVALMLHDLTANPWIWIDFYLALEFEIRSLKSDSHDTHTWTADDFWVRFLNPLSNWLFNS